MSSVSSPIGLHSPIRRTDLSVLPSGEEVDEGSGQAAAHFRECCVVSLDLRDDRVLGLACGQGQVIAVQPAS